MFLSSTVWINMKLLKSSEQKTETRTVLENIWFFSEKSYKTGRKNWSEVNYNSQGAFQQETANHRAWNAVARC